MFILSSIGASLAKSLTFAGRSTRSQYLLFVLFTVAVGVVIWQEGAMIAVIDALGGFGVFIAILGFVFSVGLAIPLMSISVRRLHDTNRSAWWLLLVPTMLVFAIAPSTPGVNRFGDPSED